LNEEVVLAEKIFDFCCCNDR